ncbi:TrkA family potassium uptake protein [Luteitalea sp.]|uniref:potassium channel family protein n=1 Tax=Luteitalea sp. TaxID=2004800 RepID=UPI0025BE85B5|nr:potassium channel protein [Luteitalea sp.]
MNAAWSKTSVQAVILLLAIVTTGTVGYMLIEGWSAWDSLYMTVISLTTVGYREVHPLTRAGEAFTMVVLVGGVGTVLYSFTLIGASVIESTLHSPWERRRISAMLDRLEHHFIVCGYGRIGGILVDEFRRQRVPYVVVERDPERLRALIEAGHLAVEGDASSEEVLAKARVSRARGLIAALSSDAENVYTILTARLMHPPLYIIGRAESDESGRKITRAGADRVISPYQIGGQHMAQLALRPAVVDFVQLATSSEFLELSMEQIEVRADGPLTGHTLVSANLRQKFGVIVVGIRRANGRMEFNPAPEARMEAGDHLVLLGPADRLAELAGHAGVSTATR